MLIAGLQTVKSHVHVEICSTEILDTLYKEWQSSLEGVNSSYYLLNGKWSFEEYGGSHSWEETIRDATPEEIEINAAFTLLRGILC